MFDVLIDRARYAELLDDAAAALPFTLQAELEDHIPESPEVIAMTVAARVGPRISVALQVRAPIARLTARVWITDTLVGLVERQAPDEDPTYRLVVADVDAFPRLIAELVDLGPRPRPEAPGFALPPGALALLANVPDAADREELSRPLLALNAAADLDAALREDSRRWVLEVAPGASLSDPPLVVDVVDAPGRGMWMVRGADDDGTTLLAADPSVVWSTLSGLVDSALFLGLTPEDVAPGEPAVDDG